MIKKYAWVLLVMICYLLWSSSLSHAISMNIMQQPLETTNNHIHNTTQWSTDKNQSQSTNSDCRIAEKSQTSQQENLQNNNKHDNQHCFDKCFWVYDTLSSKVISFTQSSKLHNTVYHFDTSLDMSQSSSDTGIVTSPPDDRCIIKGKKTPHFSHKNTTKRE